MKKQEKEYTITHKIRLMVEGKRPTYYWTPIDARNAKLLADKVKFVINKTRGISTNDEEIVNTISFMIDHLPTFWASKWTIPIINSQFESLFNQIKNEQFSQERRNELHLINNFFA